MILPIFILVTVIVLSALLNAPTGLITVFFFGIIVDLWMGNTLGMSTMLFLGICALVNLYKRNFRATSIWFLAPFSLFVVIGLFMVRETRLVSRQELLGLAISTLLVVGSFWIFIKLWHIKTKASDLSV